MTVKIKVINEVDQKIVDGNGCIWTYEYIIDCFDEKFLKNVVDKNITAFSCKERKKLYGNNLKSLKRVMEEAAEDLDVDKIVDELEGKTDETNENERPKVV